jgi:hypothetical protein
MKPETYSRDGRPEHSEESARPITDFFMHFKRFFFHQKIQFLGNPQKMHFPNLELDLDL